MPNLLKNKYFFILLLSIISCTTPSAYKVLDHNEYRTELLITPDRLSMVCEDQQDPNEKPEDEYGRYGFMIHILDDENTVLTITQTNIIDKKGCFDRIEKISTMQKKSKYIYLGGMGDLDGPRKIGPAVYDFPGKGKFKDNNRGLQFNFIKGDNGTCYTAHEGDICHSDEFPIRKLPF